MFRNFSVKSSSGDYFVNYGPWKDSLATHLNNGDVVIIDQVIARLYPSTIVSIAETNKILIEATEDTKSYESIGRIIEQIVSKGFSKNNKLVAIGGGITQDVTSFAASILLRGVDWTFFPTNLASQCDSCIGSKTSVNLGSYKNQLGGFCPPREIFIDFTFCKTLPPIDICAGLGEMMHYFLVDGPDSIQKLAEEVKEAKTNDHALSKLIERSLHIKKAMVEIDEFDEGPRRVFNYGHTFGHALEAATNFAVPHGVAVAYGMDLANMISFKLGLIDINLRNQVRPILQDVFDICPIPSFEIDRYIAALMKDKKNVHGKLNAIMTRGLGDMYQTPVELTDEIRNLISDFFKLKLYEENL
jgi:3-dehydroquinate synthase